MLRSLALTSLLCCSAAAAGVLPGRAARLKSALRSPAALDLTRAGVVVSASATPRERKAALVLIEEVERRSGIRWPLAAGAPAIRVERGAGPAEGYRLHIGPDGVTVSGNDERGVLFGVGRLLRTLRMSPGAITAPDTLDVSTPRAICSAAISSAIVPRRTPTTAGRSRCGTATYATSPCSVLTR